MRNGNGHCDGIDVPPKHAQPSIPRRNLMSREQSGIPRGFQPKEPKMVRRQRRGRALTAPTIGSSFYLHQYPVIYVVYYEKKGPPPRSPTVGDPTARWQRSRPIDCSRWVDRCVLRRSTPLLYPHGVVVRRVAMSSRLASTACLSIGRGECPAVGSCASVIPVQPCTGEALGPRA